MSDTAPFFLMVGSSPYHALLLAGLAARLLRTAAPLLRGLPALQHLRQDRCAPPDRTAQDLVIVGALGVGALVTAVVIVVVLAVVVPLFLAVMVVHSGRWRRAAPCPWPQLVQRRPPPLPLRRLGVEMRRAMPVMPRLLFLITLIEGWNKTCNMQPADRSSGAPPVR